MARGMADEASRMTSAEIARLAVGRRLAAGTAHAMNNALTAAIGEAGFLYDDHKEDPAIAEASQAILVALDRCARLSQALLTYGETRVDTRAEADLVRAVRDRERWLREAIGSRNHLAVEAPDDLVLVAVPEQELELLVTGLVVFAADQGRGAGSLCLNVEAGGPAELPALRLVATADEMSDEAVATLEDPRHTETARDAALVGALREQVAARGGSWHVARTDPQSWALIVRLPLAS